MVGRALCDRRMERFYDEITMPGILGCFNIKIIEQGDKTWKVKFRMKCCLLKWPFAREGE